MKRVQHLQRGQLGEQGNLKRAPAQQFGGGLVGLAAVGKDKVLYPKKVTLNHQKFVDVPVAAFFQLVGRWLANLFGVVMPAPKRRSQCRSGFAVVIKGNLGLDAKGGGGGNGVCKGHPRGIEVIQP